MSELIQMRQRIKAIESTKKITHAMRLIAMSSHARLRVKKTAHEQYQHALHDLLARIRTAQPTWNNPILYPTQGTPLVIVIGSQKGLCGTFNINLFSVLQRYLKTVDRSSLQFITIGKKAVDFMRAENMRITMEFSEFNARTVAIIARTIAQHIMHKSPAYGSVTVFYNYPKSFFVQVPQKLNLIPVSEKPFDTMKPSEEYRWEQEPSTILDILAYNVIETSLHEMLIQSLIAEQAARFIAMDNSTRNATNLLDTMNLEYNKVRQTKITREITDLVASF